MSEQTRPHLEALRRWIEQQLKLPASAPELSFEERKQLQAVNKSIQQLTSLGVSIPDDLRQLKLQLSAKDSGGATDPARESRLAEVESLLDHLHDLTQEARSLRNRLKSNGQTSGRKRHYGVSLEELLENEILSTDDKLELQWKKDGPVFPGKVQADGTVSAKTSAGWQTYKSLSTAATEIGERPLNGWDHWYRVESNGSRTPLSVIRAKFMEEGGKA